MFMFRSGPLKCFPRRRRQILWRLRLFYGSLALPPPRSPAPPLPAEGTQLAAPFSPLRPRTERADVGPSADGPLSLPEKRKDGKGDGQLGGCLQRVEPHKNGHFGVLCVLFSHRRCALHPLPSKGQGEGTSRNINLPTGRESPSLPGRQKTRTSTFITSLLPLLPS